ncbi:MAG: heavy-metal-associated domain-containing protein [Epsilonproteobacteria bacterium]|nr:heavy-metal-associated domain-containing protein [Campylobacterota bacterium]
MKKRFKVQNIKCGGCANTLKTKLEPIFGTIEVDLEVMPREITLNIDEEQEQQLRDELRSLGYPMADEQLGFVQNSSAKAKSFVSCAVGKFELAKEK